MESKRNRQEKKERKLITDQKYHYPAQIKAEIKEGDDFPGLYGHSSVFMKNNIVLFGGNDSNGLGNNVLHIFNLKTNKWQKKQVKGESNEIPKPRSGHTANVIGNFIYIIGGELGYFDGDKKVYKIEFDTQNCQIIGEIIDPVQSHTANVYNQNIYIFGGRIRKTGKYSSKLQKFNLLTKESKEIKAIGYQPEGRYHHRSIIVQDTLYIFGGYSSSGYLQNMFSVNLSSNQFTKIEQNGLIPSPSCSFSFFVFLDKFYLFGGNSYAGYYSDFFNFDVNSSTWEIQKSKSQKYLLKRGEHSTVAVKESSFKLKAYLIGGRGGSSIYKNMNEIVIIMEPALSSSNWYSSLDWFEYGLRDY